MQKDEVKNDSQPIQAYSFMVEVIAKPKCPKQFIVRVQAQNGPAVACMGTVKELHQFIDTL